MLEGKNILSTIIILLLFCNILHAQKNNSLVQDILESTVNKKNPCPDIQNDYPNQANSKLVFKPTSKNRDSISKIYERALRGEAESQFQIGSIYQEGQYVQQSLYNAGRWFSKAASQHHMKAAYEMAMLVESDYPHDQMLMTRYLILGLQDKKEDLAQDTLWVKGNEYFKNDEYDRSSTYLKILVEKFL